jgi:hypothetical protein
MRAPYPISTGKPSSAGLLSLVIKFLAALLVLRVTGSVVLGYGDYFPPNFHSDFLLGREGYFYGIYQSAFYAHIVAGPVALLAGLALVSDKLRQRWPTLHRSVGKIQIALVTLVVAPSGAWMAWYARPGSVAAAGFFLLAIATAICAVMGWRAALRRQFAGHRQWMMRCFALLCSAVVVRIIGGLTVVTGADADWVYAVTAWGSWLAPLAALELAGRQSNRRGYHSAPQKVTTAA